MDIAKLAGFDAVKLAVMIVQAAQMVRYNKKTCQQLVHHVHIIGDLLKNQPTSEMMQHPEIRNGLSDLHEILHEAYIFVTSFQNNNCIYNLIAAKKKADLLRVPQNRIDSCLQVFPLISHIDTTVRLDKILEIGQLHDGVEVAVKRCFELPSPKQLNARDLEFRNEIFFLTKLEHTSIVKLLGACMQGRERIFVYEYMANGSLDAFIFGPRRLYLDWPTRSQIIKGIAEGLLYLHKYSGIHIEHGDLKPSNILLDTDMKPKISDFGLARVYNPGVDQEFAVHIVGSMGFIAPECQERRLFSIKSDAYGFGALLLKVWGLWRAERLDKFVYLPPGDKSKTERMEILRCIQIALLCVEEDPENRPAMQDVVHMLSCQNFALPKPQRPAYLM